MKPLILAIAISLGINAHSSTHLQREMVDGLTTIENIFRNLYASAHWKKEFAGWELSKLMTEAKENVLANPEIKIKDYHQMLKKFFYSTKDYHVGFGLGLTEKSRLPLQFKRAEGKVFLVYVDRKKLSTDAFPFKPGDELVEFAGKPVLEVLKTIRLEIDQNVEETDKSLAEIFLTYRSAGRGMVVPKGPVSLGFKKQEDKKKGIDKVITFQTAWDYTEEQIDYSLIEDRLSGGDSKNFKMKREELSPAKRLLDVKMESQMAKRIMHNTGANTFSIGARKSFIPALGDKLWETDKDNPFDAYMYIDDEGNVIGYIRIPSYGAGEKESKAFAEIMKRFEKHTSALVIDQLNNPGGSVFYLYSLVSMLTDTAMQTPKHRMTINHVDVQIALEELPQLNKLKTDEEAHEFFEAKTIGGYPVDMNFVALTKAYHQFIIDQWNQGKTLTDPYHIWGVDKINASKEVKYTEPILLLVNELDFSGGDFFPAILQDNKRVKIMGTRTAGAGGYVLSQEIPNVTGLSYFSVTGSLAKRVDDNPIENLGVKPDISYEFTAKDLQEDFKPYKKKIAEELIKLIE